MGTMRAEVVRDRLGALARAGLDVDTFMRSAVDLLGNAVPFESACIGTFDPTTGLITRSRKFNMESGLDHLFAHFEYEISDFNQFAEIATRDVPVGLLDSDTDNDPEQSIRYRDFIRPVLGLRHEMRAVLVTGGHNWGGMSILREDGSSGFSPAEAEFVSGVAPTIGMGLRNGLLSSLADQSDRTHGPAVLIVGADNSIQQCTPAAEHWLDVLGREGDHVAMPLAAVVSGARAVRSDLRTTTPTARVRSRSGDWLVVSAAPLDRAGCDTGDVVLTIEEARPPEILPLIVAAYGLTEREQAVVRMVLTGSETSEIAKALHLSPYTVQDHLKSIFAKAGVNSRRELVARVFFDQYLPRIGQDVGPSGWFVN